MFTISRNILAAMAAAAALSAAAATPVDLQSDTWVAVDGLGRTMPTATENPLRTDKPRTVGIFYITWHDEGKFGMKSPYAGDVTKVLEADPEARLHTDNPQWKEHSFHWGEPEMGYFLSRDEWVIRKDLSMLSDAGVDVLILDVTNGVLYWDEWEALFSTMEKMIAEGNKVPKMCFWSYNGGPTRVVHELYDKFYKPGRYPDLWFYWEGKPLLCYNADPTVDANGTYKTEGYRPEIVEFFTLRNLWWGYYNWNDKLYVGTDDNWCFGYEMNDPRVAALSPRKRAAHHNGRPEQMAVTPAQHSISKTGKCFRPSTGEPALNQYDMPDSAYVPWLGKTVKNPQDYGIYFQDRWDEALGVDPDFIYINDWNEWTAGKFENPLKKQNGELEEIGFLGRKNPFYFVDQYNAEFNRTIQPMKGGNTDNYYMQMVQNIRRYKGVRPGKVATQKAHVKIDGRFDDWQAVDDRFFDTRGDVAHRDHNGYGGNHYTNTSGRNDIVESRVAFDDANAYFYVETAADITKYTDPNWMLLFIDTDSDPSTGWQGYDLMVNREVKNSKTTALMQLSPDGSATHVADIAYAVKGNRMELAIPLSLLGATAADGQLLFKWADNPAGLESVIDLCTDGDTAPNRRFNYRYAWNWR